MAAPFGGETPLAGQDSRITVEATAGATVAAPVRKGGVYRAIGGVAADGSAYKLVNATAADTALTTVLAVALSSVNVPTAPIGVLILNPYGGFIVKLGYTGSPTLGQSVGVSAADVTKVVGIAFARGAGQIMAIDTANTEVEVLFS